MKASALRLSICWLALLGFALSCGDAPDPAAGDGGDASSSAAGDRDAPRAPPSDDPFLGDDGTPLPIPGQHYALQPNWAPDFEPPQNLIFIVLDTLGAQHLGLYGYERDTSPKLDAWAQNALVFDNVTAAASSTAPSHMSMFTGFLPPVHGVYNVMLGGADEATDVPKLLPASIKVLAEYLKDADFQTFALTDGGYLTEEMQFDRGFDHFWRQPQTVDEKVDVVLQWLARQRQVGASQRNFVFLHTYEVHSPYVPPLEHDVFTDPDYRGPLRAKVEALRNSERGGVVDAHGFLPKQIKSDAQREYLVGLYDGCVRFVDTEIARLLDYVEGSEWGADTAVVIVSDHGEAFWEHGSGNHQQLYESVVHVPWLMRIPGGPVGRRADPVSGVDVLPTVLAMLGLDPPELSDGVNTLAGVRADRPRLTYNSNPTAGGGLGYRRLALKLLKNFAIADWEAYALDVDPQEHETLPEIADLTRRFAVLLRQLDQNQAKLRDLFNADEAATGVLSDETLQSLRALGYVK